MRIKFVHVRERSNIMTLREGVCSNRQSTVILGGGGWPNRHITFVVAKKA